VLYRHAPPSEANKMSTGKPKESVIRLMTRLSVEHEAVNLSQGFTDESPPYPLVWGGIRSMLGGTPDHAEELEGLTLGEALERLGETASSATGLTLREILAGIQGDRDQFNQYSYPFGLPQLRNAVCEYTRRFYGFQADPDTEVTIVLGATEGLSSVLRAVCEPGDGVVVFQPFHEMYPAQANIFSLRPQFVTLRENESTQTWELDRDELRRVAGESTRALVLNTPHNPTGKVFSAEDLQFIADLCIERNVLAITDEIYEHIVYDGRRHHFLASLEGMKERTLVVNSISKTGSATGWRVGWVLSPESFTTAIRSIHDTLVIQAPTPLQLGSTELLGLGDSFYGEVAESYRRKREILLDGLRAAGFQASPPEGSYYLFARYRGVEALKRLSPMDAAMHLIEKVGVASVPGDNFYHVGDEGDDYLRFAFCRSEASLEEAVRRFDKHL